LFSPSLLEEVCIVIRKGEIVWVESVDMQWGYTQKWKYTKFKKVEQEFLKHLPLLSLPSMPRWQHPTVFAPSSTLSLNGFSR